MKSAVTLLVIVILASVIRLWDIGRLPNGLHWDEQDTGYQAYSLLRTGRDYFGNPLPVFPHSFAEFRTPVFIYSTVPFVTALGLTSTAVRLPAAFFGILFVILMYALGSLLFKNLKIGRLAAFSAALSPRHVQYSRQSVETGSALFLFLLGFCLLVRGIRKKTFLPFAGLFLSLSTLAYAPLKLFVPLILIVFLFINRKSYVINQQLLIGLSLFILIFTPIFIDGLIGKSGQRFRELSILTDPTVSSTVDNRRLTQQLSSGVPRQVGLSPRVIDRLLVNKPILWAKTFLENYFHTFSTQYLFTIGDTQLRHSPGRETIGMLHLIEALPLLVGLAILFTTKTHSMILFWLFLAPLPGSLTRSDNPHAARLLILLPALIFTISLGLWQLTRWVKLTIPVYLVFLAISSLFIYNYFFSNYRWESAKPFQWGFDAAISTSIS